ncbi:hypothetical protein FHS85_004062 [Rhodoligotrophos appendicifer]|uniref:BA14K family protein n=1 Tax=Rhodoligotrophos appendicifer TaxID=987056 RepID=UPI001185B1DE|nr:BA14K family protein [Rhodoligotrophos appendicifer]
MNFKIPLGAAALGFGLLAGGMTSPASASMSGLTGSAVGQVTGTNSMIHEVQSRKHRYSRSYNRGHHGPRYRHKRRGYNYYHGGYYYSTPWWVGAAAGAAIIGGLATAGAAANAAANSGNHVAWCNQRYRSYNPATDSYMGYDGQRHRCYSPY